MPLESLNNENINIHDLTIEEEKKPMTESERLYKAFKKTALYDGETNQWKEMGQNQKPGLSDRDANAQLVGVLVESQFDKSSAEKLYHTLKLTQLYDRKDNQWNKRMDRRQDLTSSYRSAENQLYGVLVELQFNKKSAQELYESLKESPIYDKNHSQWKCYRDENHPPGELSYRDASAQLVGILVEFQFNQSSARKLYETLIRSKLYDNGKKQWNDYMDQHQILVGGKRKADAQLLGVLVESLFDKTIAKKIYDGLKETPLYDSKREQWNSHLESWGLLSGITRLPVNQLLSVLCEREFEEKPDLKPSTTPLPEKRSY